ncbi:MAG: hypothetical protein QN168_03395 [Armatimonadota bacterium]|nr:hypothetical protein [Armatimonadota bacterium]
MCAAGFAVTLATMATFGYGLDRWVFALLVWAALVFLPLRILLDASETPAARMRRALAGRIANDPGRYDRPGYLPVIVEELAARRVAMPRICHPLHGRQATAAAVALVTRAWTRPDAASALRQAIATLVSAVWHDATSLSAAATGASAENIQARWGAARALGGMSALTTILAAVYADRWGRDPVIRELEGRTLDGFLAAASDYCDEAALQVDALPWTEPPVASSVPEATVNEVRGAWQAFLAAGLPAPRALDAFVRAVLPAEGP